MFHQSIRPRSPFLNERFQCRLRNRAETGFKKSIPHSISGKTRCFLPGSNLKKPCGHGGSVTKGLLLALPRDTMRRLSTLEQRSLARNSVQGRFAEKQKRADISSHLGSITTSFAPLAARTVLTRLLCCCLHRRVHMHWLPTRTARAVFLCGKTGEVRNNRMGNGTARHLRLSKVEAFQDAISGKNASERWTESRENRYNE
jgi:hypothetical protein